MQPSPSGSENRDSAPHIAPLGSDKIFRPPVTLSPQNKTLKQSFKVFRISPFFYTFAQIYIDRNASILVRKRTWIGHLLMTNALSTPKPIQVKETGGHL
jgi:hypothetical protein